MCSQRTDRAHQLVSDPLLLRAQPVLVAVSCVHVKGVYVYSTVMESSASLRKYVWKSYWLAHGQQRLESKHTKLSK